MLLPGWRSNSWPPWASMILDTVFMRTFPFVFLMGIGREYLRRESTERCEKWNVYFRENSARRQKRAWRPPSVMMRIARS